MKRQWLHILLLLVYSMSLIRPIWPLVDFALQQEYYAEVLCYNKAKPALKCKGQCILMQRLQAAAQKEAPQPFVPSSVQAGEEVPELPPTLYELTLIYPLIAFLSPQSDPSLASWSFRPLYPPPKPQA